MTARFVVYTEAIYCTYSCYQLQVRLQSQAPVCVCQNIIEARLSEPHTDESCIRLYVSIRTSFRKCV